MTNGFKLIGISVRTTNRDNQAATDIPALWQRFCTENILERIPNKTSGDIYAIYTDYKSDYTEDYTTIIGAQVSSTEEVPAGLIAREFADEKFKKFTAKGDMPGAVLNTWIDIWQRDKELNRKYTYDLEVYGDKCQLGENSEVDIYIAVQ